MVLLTEKIYYKDQYIKKLEANITKVEGNSIMLDKTIFIPQSNTEPGDYGKINGIKISGSRNDGIDIWHIFQKTHSNKIGETVRIELDWKKRFEAMRLHSALHLLAGPFDKNYGKRPIAGTIRGNQAYLIFKDEVPGDIIQKVVTQVNKDIENGLEIKSYWDKKREGFRWTQVGNYIPIPDGGLHVKNTNEIGNIKLVEMKEEKDKQKIVISCE